MDANTRYEITAEAFFISTGHMAPGKDVAAGGGAAPREERSKLFAEWQAENMLIIDVMLLACDRIIGDNP